MAGLLAIVLLAQRAPTANAMLALDNIYLEGIGYREQELQVAKTEQF
jgi:hypothetical protein